MPHNARLEALKTAIAQLTHDLDEDTPMALSNPEELDVIYDHIAVLAGDKQIRDELLNIMEQNPAVFEENAPSGHQTWLSRAIESGNLDLIDIFLENCTSLFDSELIKVNKEIKTGNFAIMQLILSKKGLFCTAELGQLLFESQFDNNPLEVLNWFRQSGFDFDCNGRDGNFLGLVLKQYEYLEQTSEYVKTTSKQDLDKIINVLLEYGIDPTVYYGSEYRGKIHINDENVLKNTLDHYSRGTRKLLIPEEVCGKVKYYINSIDVALNCIAKDSNDINTIATEELARYQDAIKYYPKAVERVAERRKLTEKIRQLTPDEAKALFALKKLRENRRKNVQFSDMHFMHYNLSKELALQHKEEMEKYKAEVKEKIKAINKYINENFWQLTGVSKTMDVGGNTGPLPAELQAKIASYLTLSDIAKSKPEQSMAPNTTPSTTNKKQPQQRI